MSNSYGFDGNIPSTALYGIYDTDNGEWMGDFQYYLEEAKKVAEELRDDPRLNVISVADEGDWL